MMYKTYIKMEDTLESWKKGRGQLPETSQGKYRIRLFQFSSSHDFVKIAQNHFCKLFQLFHREMTQDEWTGHLCTPLGWQQWNRIWDLF